MPIHVTSETGYLQKVLLHMPRLGFDGLVG